MTRIVVQMIAARKSPSEAGMQRCFDVDIATDSFPGRVRAIAQITKEKADFFDSIFPGHLERNALRRYLSEGKAAWDDG